MTDPTPEQRILDGHSEALGDLQRRVDEMERLVQAQKAAMREFTRDLHVEWRQQLLDLAHDLRDNSDFAKPFWASGVDHVSDHLSTDRGQKAIQSPGFTKLAEWWVKVQMKLIRSTLAEWVLVIVVSASGIAFLMWLGSMGFIAKALGVK